MVFGRLKDAVSDVTETIRRAFQDPSCRTVPTRFRSPEATTVRPLEATCLPVAYRFEPGTGTQELRFHSVVKCESAVFESRVCREDAWSAWAAGPKVCAMPVFRVGNCGRLSIPPLPRAVPARSAAPPPFRASSRSLREAIAAPAVRGIPARIVLPRVQRSLEAVLALPIAIAGADFQKLPRALNMRYAFQLVKATGENIRNLDVLGVYPVPVKGVVSLRHDPRTGRILVNLDQEAAGARRGRFILARKKDDRSFVSCFVEE